MTSYDRSVFAELLAAAPEAPCHRQSAEFQARRLASVFSAPSDKQIRILEKQGNRCHDWSLVRLHPDCELSLIEDCRFRGQVSVGRLQAQDLSHPDGGTIECGLRGSSFEDTLIGDQCAIVSSQLTGSVQLGSCVVVSASKIIGRQAGGNAPSACRYGNGQWIDIGIETGGRSVPIFADLSMALAEAILRLPGNAALKEQLDQWMAERWASAGQAACLVGDGACIIDTRLVQDSFIGQHARIVRAELVAGSTLDSTLTHPVLVSSGSLVERSILQEGSSVENQAIVRDSLLFEHSHATDHGTVVSSLIGPNSGVAKGETTACFLGPFVGFHHQSLLIATFWPAGRGNVGYGANVGSNHTSRLADQECWPGEGQFFGLSCCVKFPANYAAAPYSVIATGVTCLPQRLEFPFSLITEADHAAPDPLKHLNSLSPGWNLSENYYALKRNEEKYLARNKATRNRFDLRVFRPEILEAMQTALMRLEAVSSPQDYYTEEDIPGLGKNYLTEKSRLRAIASYRFFLDLAELREKARNGSIDSAAKSRLKDMLPRLLAMAERSRKRDYERGCAIMDDYDLTHVHPDQDSFLVKLRQEIAAELASLS